MRTHGALTEVLGRRGGDARVGSLFHHPPTRSFLHHPSLPSVTLHQPSVTGQGFQSWSQGVELVVEHTQWCVFQWE